MSRSAPRALIVAILALGAALVPSAAAHAGGPGVWTKIAVTDSGSSQVGLLRTADGKLHLVYEVPLKDGHHSLKWATISLAGQLLASGGTKVTDWQAVESDPRLISDGSGGMRAAFKGGQDTDNSNFFARGPVYDETSSNGSTWTLQHETLGHHTDLNGTFAAAAEHDGTPVTSFGLNSVLYFHEGTDPNAPSSTSDGEIDGPSGTFQLTDQALAIDKDGSVWEAWFQSANSTKNQGYYVEKILLGPQGQPMKAPGSGLLNKDNSPRFSAEVAFVARPGGGLYLAYCSPTSTQTCAHIDLWKVGSSTAKVVPDSGTHNAQSVGLAAGLRGRISVFWMDFGQNKLHVIRTNKAATAFGVDRIIRPPPGTLIFDQIQGEGTFGRLDLVANIRSTKSGAPIEFWDTQVLAGLSLKASPSKFSHASATTVTFTVTDAGDPVSGATVSCIGKSGKTALNGQVKLLFPKGTATGKHVCTAAKTDYNVGKTTITVT